MIYNIHLISRARDSRITRWSQSRRDTIASELNRMYSEILQSPDLPSGCPYTNANATFGGGTIKPEEVACVIVDSRANSLIAQQSGGNVESRGACYRTEQGMLAEVFLDQTRNFTSADLAALIMHELVHYKLDADPDAQAVPDVHRIEGSGLHQSLEYQNNTLAPAVRDRMAARLMHPVTPYVNAEWGLRRAG